MPETSRKHSPWLVASAIFAMVWIVTRACVQSITIDEADGYLFFAAPPGPAHWIASSTNHLLNSLVMRLAANIFGLSPVIVRLPALIGAAIYIGAAYYLVRTLTAEKLLRLALFVCLVYNPFVMDHLVAGRGYSLGIAFLLLGVALASRALLEDAAHPLRLCALCSLCAALSFCGTFSFGFVNAVFLAFLAVAVWRRYKTVPAVRIVAACILPGLALTGFLAGSILANWRAISLAYGSKSLTETALSVIAASTYEPSYYLLNPPLHEFVAHWRRLLVPLLTAACLFQSVVVLLHRATLTDDRSRRVARFGAWCAGILAAALAVHFLAYQLFGILMPLGRRAVFIPPLLAIGVGALIATRIPSALGRWSRTSAVAMLCVCGLYFLGCLRLNYFMEWRYNADAARLYSVVAYYNHACGVREVSANWRYVSVLNFYRLLSGHETLQEVPRAPAEVADYPPGKPLYVVFYTTDLPFIQSHGLKVVYHDLETDAAVAIPPAVAPQP